MPYLDEGAPKPSKYARAIIFEGGKAEPDSQEYMIGPLPLSAETTIEKLDYMYNGGSGGSVPFNARYFDGPRSTATDPLVASIMSNISDITAALFQGAAYYGSTDERSNMTLTSGTPLSFDGTSAFRSIMFRFPGPASYMTPLDFFLLIDCTGTDASLYFLKGFVTNEKFFPTIAELRTAFEAGELAMEYDQTLDADWALVDYKPELGVRDLEERLAPSTLEIGGKRYKLDEENQYVEYMGWSFYLTFSRTLGIMFYDIKFKGERILYELSMQEATAQYGKYSAILDATFEVTDDQVAINLKLQTPSTMTPTTNLVPKWVAYLRALIVPGARLSGISPIHPTTQQKLTQTQSASLRLT